MDNDNRSVTREEQLEWLILTLQKELLRTEKQLCQAQKELQAIRESKQNLSR